MDWKFVATRGVDVISNDDKPPVTRFGEYLTFKVLTPPLRNGLDTPRRMVRGLFRLSGLQTFLSNGAVTLTMDS